MQPILQTGSNGESVLFLQFLLNIRETGQGTVLTMDGLFGPRTDNRVRQFQTTSQLTTDGIVGPQTWGVLEKTRYERNSFGVLGGEVKSTQTEQSPALIGSEEDAVFQSLSTEGADDSWPKQLGQVMFELLHGPMGPIMSGRMEPLADGFDALAADLIESGESHLQRQRSKLPKDSSLNKLLYYNVALNQEASIGGAKILKFLGSGAADLLRYGETFRKAYRGEDFSMGAVVRDGLRVVSVLPVGKIGQMIKLKAAQMVPIGPMSCAPTAGAKALILSGQASPWSFFSLFDDMVKTRGQWSGMNALMKGYTGEYLQSIVYAIKAMGRPIKGFNVRTLSEVEKLAARLREPVMFELRWVNDTGHVMTAYWTKHGVRFADQFGDAWKLLDDGTLKNLSPTALGSGAEYAKYTANQISHLAQHAFSIQEHWWVRAADQVQPLLQRSMIFVNQAISSNPKTGPKATAMDVLAEGLMEPIFPLEPNRAALLEAAVRIATRRPRPKMPWDQPNPKKAGLPIIKDRSRLAPVPTPGWLTENRTDHPKLFSLMTVPGDTLFGLARLVYNNAAAWPWIRNANPQLPVSLKPSDGLKPGMVLHVIGL